MTTYASTPVGDNGSSKAFSLSPKGWAALAIWIGPYLALSILRYGFDVHSIGSPLSWLLSLAGLQLFASVGLVARLSLARSFAVVALVLYTVYFSGVVPGFAAVGSILPQLCIVALMAISIWFPFASGQLSLAQAGFMALGAYGSAWLTTQLAWPFWAALALASFATALFGFVVSYPALRLRGVYLAVATLGLAEVIRIFFVNFEPTGGAFGFTNIPKYTQTWHLLLALAIICLILFSLMRGRVGRAIWAVRTDPIAAASLGISITRVRIFTFTCGAFIAALAGGLHAHYIRFISPDDFGLEALIDWLVMVMLGGFETFVGILASTVVIGTLPELMRYAADWRLLINGTILVIFLILCPGGIVTRQLLGWRFSPSLRGRSSAPETSGGPTGQSGGSAPDTTPAASSSNMSADSESAGEQSLAVCLDISSVQKKFGGIVALNGVSLRVHERRIHGLIGPNGAGKTTLFNAVAGFYDIDGGEIRYNGTLFRQTSPQKAMRMGIARTFQNIRLFGDLSVLENVMLGAHKRFQSGFLRCALFLDYAEERRMADYGLELLSLFDLADQADQRASSLSYGAQRRLEIVRALASEPRLLLLDEPAAGMNATEAAQLAQLLRQIRQQFGVTILLVEHDMELVMGLCDHLTVLNYGQPIADGLPLDVQKNPQVIAAYLGERNSGTENGEQPNV